MDKELEDSLADTQPVKAPKKDDGVKPQPVPFWVGMTAPELAAIMNAELEKRGFPGRMKVAPPLPPGAPRPFRVYFLPASRYKPKPSGSGGDGSK